MTRESDIVLGEMRHLRRNTGDKTFIVVSQRKRPSEKKAVVLGITENIEMVLFSSMEHCVLTLTQEEEEVSFVQAHPEHPLVPNCEVEPGPQVETATRLQTQPRTEPHTETEPENAPSALGLMEDIKMEMKGLPPFRLSDKELLDTKAIDPSIMAMPSPNKATRLKWKRLSLQMTGLAVKDVVCLPRGRYVAQLERHTVPRIKERASLAAMGLTARITIDHSWSANQMQSRLAMLFRGKFAKQAGQRFSFTYLQCVPGSRVLYVPDTPAEGWTGEQVLRTSGHGALYILSLQEYPHAGSEESTIETPILNRKEFCLEANTEGRAIELIHTRPVVPTITEESSLDLDAILRVFKQENMDGDVVTYIQVRRRNLLHSALKVVRRPGFCFSMTPIIAFSEEETDALEGPLREFFSLTLLELQQSSVFEGLPGRLFFTYDLAALKDRKYYEAGVLIGWSLAHGGPGPRCLHPVLFQLMCGQNPSLEDFSWRDVVDAEARIRLQQLQSCTDVRLLPLSLCDWVSTCGIPGVYSAHSDEIPSIYIRLVKHYIYHRVACMISQFTEGMNSCGGFWGTVQSHWEEFLPVMTSAQRQPLMLEEFKKLINICYSRADSHLRAAEEETARHWEKVLTLVSDGQAECSFEDLLTFITGTDHLPPLGFPRLISLCFFSQDVSMSGVCLPHASTCALEFFLPRGMSAAADLMVMLSRAMHVALGFKRFQIE
ncbi:hypothetical protein CesoFtcFv8_004784 [Champsocephalus esox]|uniref:HECT domain-containing protein n=1 Tax=Champsocephalus esox TaxID=159716 RepID=A0AAN8H8Z6_9TELE|nr:hypothetical protein CesoFtcFv8_004784 [Champsocephalus esox]